MLIALKSKEGPGRVAYSIGRYKCTEETMLQELFIFAKTFEKYKSALDVETGLRWFLKTNANECYDFVDHPTQEIQVLIGGGRFGVEIL